VIKSKKFSFAIYDEVSDRFFSNSNQFKESQPLYLFCSTEKTYSDNSVFLITQIICGVVVYLED